MIRCKLLQGNPYRKKGLPRTSAVISQKNTWEKQFKVIPNKKNTWERFTLFKWFQTCNSNHTCQNTRSHTIIYSCLPQQLAPLVTLYCNCAPPPPPSRPKEKGRITATPTASSSFLQGCLMIMQAVYKMWTLFAKYYICNQCTAKFAKISFRSVKRTTFLHKITSLSGFDDYKHTYCSKCRCSRKEGAMP